MIAASHLSRGWAACRRETPAKSVDFTGRTRRNGNLVPVDIVIDQEAVRGAVIEIKTPAVWNAESLLLGIVEAFAANSPPSDSDEQVLLLP